MAKITVSIKGMNEAINAMKLKGEKVKAQVDAELQASAQIIVNNAVRDAPTDESRLRQSISYSKQGEMSYKVVADVFYAPYIEWGTKRRIKIPSDQQEIAAQYKGRAKRGDYYDFLTSILKWVKRKGIIEVYAVKTQKRRKSGKDFNLALEQIAQSIATSIIRNGIHPKPFFWHNVLKERPRLIDRIQKIVK
jgi:HK97 gp10 family phage protein